MVTFISVLFATFHLYTGVFGSFPPSLQRPIHLVFGAILAFMITKRDRKKIAWFFLDITFSIVALLVFGYFLWKHEAISNWVPFVTHFKDIEFFICVLATFWF